MFNILKMDMYKMFKSKSLYLISVISLVLIVLFAILLRTTFSINYELAKEANMSIGNTETIANSADLTEDEYYNMQKELKDSFSFEDFLSMGYGGAFIYIGISIFMAMFICSEWDTGFIKNIIPIKNSRLNIVLSKNIILVFFLIIQGLAVTIGSIIANFAMNGKVNIGNLKEILSYVGTHNLLLLAFGSLIILLSYIFRNKAAVITIGILLAMGVHTLGLGLLDKIFDVFGFTISELSIIENKSLINFGDNNFKKVILIFMIYFILYNLISIIKVKRVEVN